MAHNDVTSTNSLFAIGYGDFRRGLMDPPTVLVHHNHVRMVDGVFSTFLTHGNVDSSVWKQNIVVGSTVNVIAMRVDGWGPAEGNLFKHNDIDVVLADGSPHPLIGAVPNSHLYFGVGADNNFAYGFEGLLPVDSGQGNIIR